MEARPPPSAVALTGRELAVGSTCARHTEPMPEEYVGNDDTTPSFAFHQATVHQGFKSAFGRSIGAQAVATAQRPEVAVSVWSPAERSATSRQAPAPA